MPVFVTPTIADVPRVLPETRGPALLLMRHYRNLSRGRSVVWNGANYRTVDGPTTDQLTAAGAEGVDFFLGGHEYTVTDAVGVALVADGYADGFGAPTVHTLYPAADGTVRSSSAAYATARAGGSFSVDATSAIRSCGQTLEVGTYYIWEQFLSFDTSAVAGVVTSATLYVYGAGQDAVTAFTLEARRHTWGPTLTSADWVAGADLAAKPLLASVAATDAFSTNAYTALTSEAAFLTNIDQAGTTDILLCSSRLTTGIAPAGGESIDIYNVEETGTSRDPKLVITAVT